MGLPSYFAVAMGVTPESSWASTYPQGPIQATSTWPLASATEIPAQSVVRDEVEVTPECFGHVREERLIRLLGLGGCRLQGNHAEAKLALVLSGDRKSDRHRE